jgi:L-alanine-DL-glutamate epimerase-like enolase superfamily enzyme
MNKIHSDFIAIEKIKVFAYKIPTDAHEADGTLDWDSTILILVESHGGGKIGLGYTYADLATAQLINDQLSKVVLNKNALTVKDCWVSMVQSIRNLGRPGISSMAISAVDTSLWELKAKILNTPLATLLDQVTRDVPIYGSGGFTSYSNQQLTSQLENWKSQGITRFKIKVGRDFKQDIERVKLSREIIGPDAELYVDANGAYSRKEALYIAERFSENKVTWFEEPVVADDLPGLHLMRNRAPAGMEIAAGEYGYDLVYFKRMLESEAVDVLQADATRCGGYTTFLQAGALCHSRALSLSSHCAPQLHMHACSALISLRHLEYFHDHVRIENMLFDGAISPRNGTLTPDLMRPGMGLEFKFKDAARFQL